MTTLLRRMWCRARRGHDYMLTFGLQRLFLLCPTCLAETAGWALPDTTARSRDRRSKAVRHTQADPAPPRPFTRRTQRSAT